MLTEFGKALRKLRLDETEILKDMAMRLNISSAYLSAIENGKRPIPQGFIDALTDLYQLSGMERKSLEEAADKSLRDVGISLGDEQGSKRDLALIFARSFDSMDDATANRILAVLQKKAKSSEQD